MQKESAELIAKGEYMATFGLMKAQAQKLQVVLAEENKRYYL